MSFPNITHNGSFKAGSRRTEEPTQEHRNTEAKIKKASSICPSFLLSVLTPLLDRALQPLFFYSAFLTVLSSSRRLAKGMYSPLQGLTHKAEHHSNCGEVSCSSPNGSRRLSSNRLTQTLPQSFRSTNLIGFLPWKVPHHGLLCWLLKEQELFEAA